MTNVLGLVAAVAQPDRCNLVLPVLLLLLLQLYCSDNSVAHSFGCQALHTCET
jgi:hypothetical protein